MARNLIRTIASVVMVAGLVPSAGCRYDEGLIISNMKGTVLLPREAATRTFVREDGTEETITDPRLIGPVYLGVYPKIEPANVVDNYPHPELGPQYQEDIQGDAYPYGGTTVGDLRYACFEYLTCKVVSGRYVDFESMITWWADVLELPIVDEQGQEVTSGDYLRDTCYTLLDATTDAEVRITASEDRNDDGAIDELDLDFVENADGDFVAEFTLWQQEFFWDQEQEDCTPGQDCTGFELWGFVDMPSTVSFQYSTCNPEQGYLDSEYDNYFFGGVAYSNVLNRPYAYISEGDWVAGEGYRWDNIYDEPQLVLDFEVTE